MSKDSAEQTKSPQSQIGTRFLVLSDRQAENGDEAALAERYACQHRSFFG